MPQQCVFILLRISFFVFLYSSTVIAQTNNAEVFKNIINRQNNDTQKIKLLVAYSDSLVLNTAFNEAMLFANEALKLSKKINYEQGKGDAYLRIGVAYKMISKDDSALINYTHALHIAENNNNKYSIANTYSKLGWLYAKGEYTTAINYFSKALPIATEIKDTALTGVCYWGIAENLTAQGNIPEAFNNAFKALRFFEQVNNPVFLARIYACIGYLYDKQNKLDAALNAYTKSYEFAIRCGNKFLIATANTFLGDVYFSKKKLEQAKQKITLAFEVYKELNIRYGISESYEKLGAIAEAEGDAALESGDISQANNLYYRALDYYKPALDLNIETDWKNQIAGGYISVASIYTKLKNYTAAETYIKNGLALSEKIGSKVEMKDALLCASRLYTAKGDYKKALENHLQYIVYRDSLVNEENTEKTVQVQMQYEFDKKVAAAKAEQDKKDLVQQAQVQKLTVLRNAVIVGAALLLLFLIGLINRYRFKQRSNKELAEAYENLKATQSQLVKTEKMAAFGVMASRLGHEIQNPLNFVNNFSEIGDEIVDEVATAKTEDERKTAAKILKTYLQKINFHGKRAEKIVKQLQEHTRAGTAQQFFEEDKKEGK